MNLRIKEIYSTLARENLDGLILNSAANISYLTGYPSRDSYFLVSKKKNIYITDSRYTQEARERLKGSASIVNIRDSVFKTIARSCIGLGLKRIGFEERHTSVYGYNKLRAELNRKQELVAASPVEGLRQVKTPAELEKIRRAAWITIEAFGFIRGFICPGRKEVEIAAELERFIRLNGARSSSFDIIVASGPNSSFPHHLTSERRLKDNEPVLVDMGVECDGYKSDLTRVFFLGKMNPLLEKIYSIVRKAQDKAIKQIKPAVAINKIDKAARQYISQKGYGGFFGHNLGHGIGLEVHEKPHISGKEKIRLKAGMVFTVEPGIYLPGKFGVRLEDMVLVTRKGYEVISGSLNK